MTKNRINAADLIALGFKENQALGIALKINKERHGFRKQQMLRYYKDVLGRPAQFIDDPIFKPLAMALLSNNEEETQHIRLNDAADTYAIFGAEHIGDNARKQMDIAMKLPVTIAGALMPDAHQGYGLPIGGVLATNNAVIPYGVGVDIGCRMALSVFDLPPSCVETHTDKLKNIIMQNTRFGAGKGYMKEERAEHEVLDNQLFKDHALLRSLKHKAWSQLGSSGGGNHFVEFGIIEFPAADETLSVNEGQYLALLTHSGSRGLGATIADYYTKLAKKLCRLPREAENLAYLDLDTAEGQEYWLAMTLAGDYASACHQIIHDKISRALAVEVLAKVENHHNFAWKEHHDGKEVIVHRKGATPASENVLGIIPGSMASSGFLVRGKGHHTSINSASHGAGRLMSRTQAIKNIAKKDLNKLLEDKGITLLGAGMDEAPMAYKDIHAIMAAQTELVDIVATFSPKIVRMADDGSRED